jgi:poly-gamma-glutamate synthesis protein (capsule biosynthesis protein)
MHASDVTVYLVGDVRLGSEDSLALCATALSEADILFANLETVISDIREPSAVSDYRDVSSREHTAPNYGAAGFSVLNMANNPSMRLGWPAFARCMELLEAQGIAHIGGGNDIDEARRPAIIERDGTKIAFIGYACVADPAHAARKDRPGLARFRVHTSYQPVPRFFEVPGSPPIITTTPDRDDLVALRDNIRRAKDQADVAVISWHWGVSPATGGHNELIDYQMELGHECIDAGADLVVGHHPHALQGIEVYAGKAIFYSLGNFVPFSAPSHPEATMVAWLRITEKQVREVGFLPARVTTTNQPTLLNAADSSDVVERVRAMSDRFGTRFSLDGDSVVVETAAS